MAARKSPPPRLHAVERRQQLLETALDCFSRQGFKGTTTKEIAAAAGVTEAIVFRHFPSKQALYEAVLDYRHESAEMQEWLAKTKDCMDRGDDAGLLHAIALKILESHRRDARLQRVLLFAALEGHEHGLAHHRQISIPVYELLCQYVARRQSEGKLQDYDPGMILVAIAGMATHFATMTQMFGFACDIPDDRVAATFTSIMMTGIQPKKERARK
ncbi:Transcriptional regulator, TetR family [Candidatus Sulfopaludibacter sp. SbA3]|nr:Transcriptional regulator, TetR family [Candidatus Sulfopaludibacter sp. SbA3]